MARRRTAGDFIHVTKTLLVFSAAVLLAGCNTADSTAPAEPPPSAVYRGFDTSIYPGDAAMTVWKKASPYKWSGYYLPAPCHRDPSWSGKRAFLEGLGFGIAVIYVGQQTFDDVPDILADRIGAIDVPDILADRIGAIDVPDAIAPATATVTCSRTLLTSDQGNADAQDAIAKASAEGFPPQTVIFLDVEHMDSVTTAMDSYYRAWAKTVIASKYRPGVYVHKSNAPTIYAGYSEIFHEAGVTASPRFWLTTQTGFSLDKKPTDIGYPFANLWQGILDTDETWGGVPLHIDVDLSDRVSPSAPD